MNSAQTMPTTLRSPAVLWNAVAARDRSADGRFVYGVASTRIYCRPVCPSRRPRPDGVEYFATPSEAEAAGFRACFRCKPQNASAPADAWLAAVRAHLDRNADRTVTLAELSRYAGVTAQHLQRAFTTAYGASPRAYQAAQRSLRMQSRLAAGTSVTAAIYESGHGSAAAGYGNARTIGVHPRQVRKAATGEFVAFTVADTALGKLLAAATARGLCRVAFAETSGSLTAEMQAFRKAFQSAQVLDCGNLAATVPATVPATPPATVPQGHAKAAELLWAAVPALQAMAAGQQAARLPVELRGTVFQQKVWRALRQIPRGTTVSYSELAARLGQPTAARAVARACATNTLALAVPCHRVNAASGALAGYRWGVKRKQRLQAGEVA